MIPDNFILLAYWYGRFGNRMHEYAYGITYSKVNNIDFLLPSEWEGSRLFKNQFHKIVDDEDLKKFLFSYRPIDDEQKHEDLKKILPGIQEINPGWDGYKYPGASVYYAEHCAYSEKIYEHMSRDFLLKVFEFSDEVKDTDAYRYWENIRGSYDIAHLRRGDISSVKFNKSSEQWYSVISKDSYYRAFEKYGFNPEEMLWVSDDHKNQWHKKRKENKLFGFIYPQGCLYKKGYIFDWLDDFLSLYFARNIFRANSSFSWWASFLSPTANIYSPVLDRRHVYGIDGMEEIDVEFVEGNHPHWMYEVCKDIIIK